jgi:hypothetical protein
VRSTFSEVVAQVVKKGHFSMIATRSELGTPVAMVNRADARRQHHATARVNT